MDLVFDASTLILLAKTTLLRDVVASHRAFVPDTVRAECLAKPGPDSAVIEQLIDERHIEVRESAGDKGAEKLRRDFRLGVGEADTIWLAKTLDCAVAVDDGQAIKACKALGLRFVTAIHFLLQLVSGGSLQRQIAQEKLSELSRVGRYSTRIIEDARERLRGGAA